MGRVRQHGDDDFRLHGDRFGRGCGLCPESTTSSTAALLMSQTVRSYPAFNRFLLMGLPIIPSPINPIFLLMSIHSFTHNALNVLAHTTFADFANKILFQKRLPSASKIIGIAGPTISSRDCFSTSFSKDSDTSISSSWRVFFILTTRTAFSEMSQQVLMAA